jgi:hypothetical protein
MMHRRAKTNTVHLPLNDKQAPMAVLVVEAILIAATKNPEQGLLLLRGRTINVLVSHHPMIMSSVLVVAT